MSEASILLEGEQCLCVCVCNLSFLSLCFLVLIQVDIRFHGLDILAVMCRLLFYDQKLLLDSAQVLSTCHFTMNDSSKRPNRKYVFNIYLADFWNVNIQ